MTIPTIKIVSDRPKGFRIINLRDFDPARHQAFDDNPAPRLVKPRAKPKGHGHE